MRARRFGSRDEVRAHQILQKTLADTTWIVSKDVALSRVLVKEERLSDAEFSLYTRGSLDFVVWSAPSTGSIGVDADGDYEIEFALEVDGFGHGDKEQIARDLMKNDFCHRADIPLLRLGADHLREAEETTALEWLTRAYVDFVHQLDGSVASDEADEAEEPHVDEDDGADVGSPYEIAVGEPGIEMDHPFPDNALVARRLLQKYAIGTGHIGPIVTSTPGARYVLAIEWPGRQPPPIRSGPASEFAISERDFALVDLADRTKQIFGGTGRAEFAVSNRLPGGTSVDVGFPWDAWGVASELAEFDALRQVERWASERLGFAAKPR